MVVHFLVLSEQYVCLYFNVKIKALMKSLSNCHQNKEPPLRHSGNCMNIKCEIFYPNLYYNRFVATFLCSSPFSVNKELSYGLMYLYLELISDQLVLVFF